MSDTIVAIATSTATGAGINIVRLSGEKAKKTADEIFDSKSIKNKDMEPNHMYLGNINTDKITEKAFCVYYKKPKSYTGEDVIEFHCHGGSLVANIIQEMCLEKGCRPAEAGEFTKRAFFNGKLNLAQAEGIMEVISATNQSQLTQGYKLLTGELSQGIYKLEDRLLAIMANLEVRLDYPEETEDEPNIMYEKEISDIIGEIDSLLENTKHTKTITEGVNVAIVGLPNVGKSSLLNGLVMEDKAIVTDIAGTTRDVISHSIEIEGIKINILDTAGIRESQDEIEKIGIERTKKTIKAADIVIFVTDLTQPETESEKRIEELIKDKKVIMVANKKDRQKYPRKNSFYIKANPPREIEKVKKELLRLAERDKIFSQEIIFTNQRHIHCLKKAKENLQNTLKEFSLVGAECSLVGIRQAYGELAKITGNDISESIAEEVFSTFCVGK